MNSYTSFPKLVSGFVVLGSLAFLLGWNIDNSQIAVHHPLSQFPLLLEQWEVAVLLIGVPAGWASAGVLLTVISAWFFNLWWHTLPPLVGYMTGEWTGSSRYTYPRSTLEGYTSAQSELIAALSFSISMHIIASVVIFAALGYVFGQGLNRLFDNI